MYRQRLGAAHIEGAAFDIRDPGGLQKEIARHLLGAKGKVEKENFQQRHKTPHTTVPLENILRGMASKESARERQIAVII
jgi:hypothetical protein